MTPPELDLRIGPGAPAVAITPAGRDSPDIGWLFCAGAAVAGEPVRRPRFSDLRTADGVPYAQIARLTGCDVLAASATKAASDLAEVAEAAARLDGVRQMVLTTGTTHGRDTVHLARCVRAVTAAVPGLPVRVQIEPPEELASIAALHRAGAAALSIHVESPADEVRARWTPGQASTARSRYWEVCDEAVRVFGRNRVCTSLLVGLGVQPDELVEGARALIDHGVHPFVVALRSGAGTLAAADGAVVPPAELLADVTARVAELLAAAGMRSAGRRPGCAGCTGAGAYRADQPQRV